MHIQIYADIVYTYIDLYREPLTLLFLSRDSYDLLPPKNGVIASE